MIPLGSTPGFEHHRTSRGAKAGNITEALSYLPVIRLGVCLEERFFLAVPHYKARCGVLVGRRPVVLEVDASEGVVAGMVAVEGLVVVEEVVFGDLWIG